VPGALFHGAAVFRQGHRDERHQGLAASARSSPAEDPLITAFAQRLSSCVGLIVADHPVIRPRIRIEDSNEDNQVGDLSRQTSLALSQDAHR
jgi:hypothetical protein